VENLRGAALQGEGIARVDMRRRMARDAQPAWYVCGERRKFERSRMLGRDADRLAGRRNGIVTRPGKEIPNLDDSVT
jgi:hypothetical protein